MGYAFENVPYHELPAGEQLAIWYMNAVVRDSFLTSGEMCAKEEALKQCRRRAARC